MTAVGEIAESQEEEEQTSGSRTAPDQTLSCVLTRPNPIGCRTRYLISLNINEVKK